jgi:hypothetical protein
MKKRCTPQLVQETYKQAGSWRKAAAVLNQLYAVSLSHTSWRDYAEGRHDVADPNIRACLLLGPRPCPTCGRMHTKRTTSKRRRIRQYSYTPERKRNIFESMALHEAPR